MKPFRPKSKSQQLAAHLMQQIEEGVLGGAMPGSKQLIRELGLNSYTVEQALRQLEDEGFLIARGQGRPRLIRIPKISPRGQFQIKALLYDDNDKQGSHIVQIQHKLEASGFSLSYDPKTQCVLNCKVSRIKRMVRASPAGAWIVVGGSYEILKWFSEQDFPTFGLFGRIRDLPIAGTGPEITSAIEQAVARLLELGHRRIVMLTHISLRTPEPGLADQVFLNMLESHGIRTSRFNLPAWEPELKGVHACLEPLFKLTPPTAIFVDTPVAYHSVRDYLAQKRLDVPGDVSLICQESDASFDLLDPPVAHIQDKSAAWARRILQWARKISRGGVDVRQSRTKAEFIEGGTIGPAPK